MDFVADQARMFAKRIPRARLELLSSGAHAPSMKRPGAFDRVVFPFLAGV